MARPQNTQLKSKITQEAAAQFAAAGYNATSYTSIAQACGISRNLVQYHFPKKELLAMAYMESILEHCVAELGLDDAQLHNNLLGIKAVGTRFFQTLLAQEGTRQFLLDITAGRDLTHEVLAFDLNWILARIDVPPAADPVHIEREVTRYMGGFYDVLYWSLHEGYDFDVAAEISWVVDVFTSALS